MSLSKKLLGIDYFSHNEEDAELEKDFKY